MSSLTDLPPSRLQYPKINNGVYRCGFATSQSAYEEAVVELFEALDRYEKILEGKQYVIGDVLTESDIRLYITLVRFDPVCTLSSSLLPFPLSPSAC